MVRAHLVVHTIFKLLDEPSNLEVRLLDVRGPSQNQGNTRFVDENRIGFVNNDNIPRWYPGIRVIFDKPVAQQIKANLLHGTVDDLGAVRFPAGGVIIRLLDRGNTHAQEFKQWTHPLSVTGRQIVIHTHHVDVTTLQGVTRGRHGTHQGLTLTSDHLDHHAVKKRHQTTELHIVRTLLKSLFSRHPN